MAQTAKERYEEYLAKKTTLDESADGFFGLLITDIQNKLPEKTDPKLIEDYLNQSGLQFIEKGMIEEDVEFIQSEQDEEQLNILLTTLFEDPEYIKSYIIGAIYGYVKMCYSFDIEPDETYLTLANMIAQDSENA